MRSTNATWRRCRRLWDEVAEQLARVPTIGGQRYVDRHRARGKMLARERVEALVDRDTPLLELSPLAGWGSEFPIGAGVVNAIGVVEGVECAISATDMTYRGGSMNPRSVDKGQRFQEIVRANRLPWISLNESAGADLPYQADIFIRGGAGFKNQTQLSKLGVPTITVGFGPATAGGAYTPGMSDYTVFVKGRATAYLGGPPLVKMAIDEVVDEETLGGAEMHSRISGLSDYLAVDELDALRIARDIVQHLRWRKLGPGPHRAGRRPALRPGRVARLRVGRRARSVRDQGDLRPAARRLAVRGVQAAVRRQARVRAGARSTASPSVCSATTGSCSPRRRRRARSSSSSATARTRRSSSSTTSPASWSAPRPSRAASSATGRR